jgi:hypothetical protein
MPTHEETLKRLARTFTTRDIMIPCNALTSGKDGADAFRVSSEHPDYDVIPIISRGALTGYFVQDSGKTSSIEVNDLISDGTSLIDLVDIFKGTKFSFVLSDQYVTDMFIIPTLTTS